MIKVFDIKAGHSITINPQLILFYYKNDCAGYIHYGTHILECDKAVIDYLDGYLNPIQIC